MASHQANRTNHHYQDYGQHYRILGDVLALIVQTQLAKQAIQVRTSMLPLDSTHETGSASRDAQLVRKM